MGKDAGILRCRVGRVIISIAIYGGIFAVAICSSAIAFNGHIRTSSKARGFPVRPSSRYTTTKVIHGFWWIDSSSSRNGFGMNRSYADEKPAEHHPKEIEGQKANGAHQRK